MLHIGRLLDPAAVERLRRMSLSARRVVAGSVLGPHRSAMQGASLEFRQHRAYAVGDEPRRLDWRLLARTDRLYVKEFDEETNLRCLIAIDRSASMGYGSAATTKLEYATRFAAAVSYLLLSRGESAGIAAYGPTLDCWLSPASFGSQLGRVVDVLERVTPRGVADIDAACSTIADRLGRRALVVVVSDFFSSLKSLRAAIGRLRHRRHELILVQVADRAEMLFPFQTVYRFVGLENDGEAVVEPAAARRDYLKRLDAHQRELKKMCRVLQIDMFSCTTDLPPIDALSELIETRRH